MSGRTWLAVILCFFVWFIYMRWFAPPPPPPARKIEPNQKTVQIDPKTQNNDFALGPFDFEIPQVDLTHTLSLNKMDVGFSESGGKISSVSLKGYRETIDKNSPLVRVVHPDHSGYSLFSVFSDPSLKPFSQALFKRSIRPDGVSFEFQMPSGVSMSRVYQVTPDEYWVNETLTLNFSDLKKREWGDLFISLGGVKLSVDANEPMKTWEIVFNQNEKITHQDYTRIDNGKKFLGNSSWLAFGNRYFSSVLFNESETNPDIIYYNQPQFTGVYYRFPIALKTGQSTVAFKFNHYFGPKEYQELQKKRDLRGLLNYGMFDFIAYPLLQLLKFFYFNVIQNYGVAIILLTLVVRALFYPLSLKSYRSMSAMQKLQPQIQALKEKYKDDKERLNREQLALFKTHKVNPAGGCLPMLVQLPVFIALYSVLQNSIELFHAPFFGWIQDLSSKDPYYVFPILMGISMLIQQKLTPSVGMDPVQVKMMYLMPVVFTFIMVNLPSGLTAYIFLSTILGILQQLSLTRFKKNTMVTARSNSSP